MVLKSFLRGLYYLPIRLLLPLMIVIFSTTVVFFNFSISLWLEKVETLEESRKILIYELVRLQSSLEHGMQHEDYAAVRRHVALAGSFPDHDLILLLDPNYQILAASSIRLQGKTLSQLKLGLDTRAMQQSLDSYQMVIDVDKAQGKLTGYIPVQLKAQTNRRAGLIRPGILVFRFDAQRQLYNGQFSLLRQSLIFGAFTLLLGLGVWFLLHGLLTRRVDILLKVTERLAADELQVRTNFSGKDEIGRIGQALDHMAEQILQTRQRIEHLASHDSLTGLPNRTLGLDRLEQAIAHTHRTQETTALLFIDLDGFKPVNDRYGHLVGDLTLKRVAGLIKECLRKTDSAARFGGDEFIAVLSDIKGETDTRVIADRILQKINQPMQLQGHEITISASIGIAIYHGHTSITEDGLIHVADEAMYKAKKAGKNRIALAS